MNATSALHEVWGDLYQQANNDAYPLWFNISTQLPAGTITYTALLNTSVCCRAILQTHGMIPSMSCKGDCYDNAVAESFFANLKNELTWHRLFQSRD